MIKYAELKRRYDLDGPQKTVAYLSEALENGDLSHQDFSVRDLAEALVPDGREWVRAMHPEHGSSLVTESDAVDVTAFANITGQLLISRILESFQSEAFVLSRLVSTVPTRLDGEKIPGVARLGDLAEEVHPGMPFPHMGFGEDWIETPSTTKRGFIVPVTKEAIYFDRTHVVMSRAGEVGEFLGLNKEKRLCDLVIGATNNFNWQGTAYDTYQSSTPWINLKSGNDLEDWTDVDAAEQLFADMLDPNTGEPILIDPSGMTLLHTPAKKHTARRVVGATELRSGDITSGSGNQTISNNTVDNYRLAESRLLYRRIIAMGETAAVAAKYWFLGDFSKAFAYMQNWPITVTRAPRNSEADFNQDIVLRFKASERGAAAVLNPRFVVKNYDTSGL